MQKSYIFASTVNFSLHEFYSAPGDQGVYDASTQQMTVYRAGALVKTMPVPPHTIHSMLTLNWLLEEGAPLKKAQTKVEEESETRIPLDDDIEINPTPGFEGIEIGDRVIDETPEPEPEIKAEVVPQESIQVFSDEDEDIEVFPDSASEVEVEVPKPVKKAKKAKN